MLATSLFQLALVRLFLHEQVHVERHPLDVLLEPQADVALPFPKEGLAVTREARAPGAGTAQDAPDDPPAGRCLHDGAKVFIFLPDFAFGLGVCLGDFLRVCCVAHR